MLRWRALGSLHANYIHRLRYQKRNSFLGSSFADGPTLEADNSINNTRDAQIAEMLGSVKRGRMDLALKLAASLTDASESSTELLARECSDRAFAAYVASKEAREMAVDFALGGTSFEIPGRSLNTISPKELAEGFWLKKVSDQHELSDTIIRCVKASLSLRGLDDPSAARALGEWRFLQQQETSLEQRSCKAYAAARDWHLLGRSALVRLQTSRSIAVLQAYIGKQIAADGRVMIRCPMLLSLHLKAGRHMKQELLGPEPVGPLDEMLTDMSTATSHPCFPLYEFASQRQRAVVRHMQILTECISEASSNLFVDKNDGLEFLTVAQKVFQQECPVSEKQASLKIFRSTAETIRTR
eukprot:TRINITY_DN105410_c0_g1_i1.p1 TRINITY_DN105410_c0_g1~~TRINITY_DN105410_c0_g1_i1.p1  ORF type:complete len:356 (-),score=65.37 TRINITY_DN105410_c0_g1_i1:161-1228(-)